MLKQRVFSALVLAPIMIGACFLGGMQFLGLMAVVAGLCANEYRNMMANTGIYLSKFFVPVTMAIVLLVAVVHINKVLASICIGLLILIITSLSEGFTHAVAGVIGALYIGGLISLLAFLRLAPDGRDWCFLVVLVTWFNDISAYFGGKAFGKRKLAPKTSPGKSLEGAFFGIGAGTLVGVYFGPQVGLLGFTGALAGAFLAVLAQIGDLVESRLKRYCKVKDSGNSIPGHGGFLDRFDSLMFASAGGLLLKAIYSLVYH